MKFITHKIILCLVSCPLLWACGEENKSDILTVGYTQEAPYSYISAQGGASGLFPNMVKKVAVELGYSKVEWVLLSFDNLIPALLEKRIDLIAAGMSISKIRSQSLCFARPLVSSASALLYNKHNPRISDEQALLEQDLVLSALFGSVEAEFLETNLNEHSFVELEDPTLGLLAVKTGQVDALLMTEPSLIQLKRAQSEKVVNNDADAQKLDLKVVSTNIIGSQQAAFAFRREDSALVERWNKTQRRHAESDEFRSHAKALGFHPPQSLSLVDRESCYIG